MDKVDLKHEFVNIAGGHHVIGDPSGQSAYGYARVSSLHQSEDGASGLPRQILNIHKAAKKSGLAIRFEDLYVDDGYTGFEFNNRPALTKLRYEVRSNPQAGHLVIEEIDRLSRNSDWHQGFLLDEFSRRNVTVHFYVNPGSELERYIRGYIAQEGMKKDMARMQAGKMYKAMDGRVTATRAAYGYELSDPKDTHYVINEEQAQVVRMMYGWMAEERRTTTWIAHTLNEMGIPGRRGGTWVGGTVLNLLKNEVYKGWFVHNRRAYETAGYTEEGKPIKRWRLRPESEWIWVPVPAIVSEQVWEQAQEVIQHNRVRASKRNAGTCSNWLLSGLIECSICQYVFQAARGGTSKKGQPSPIRYYCCGGRNSARARHLGICCRSPHIHADVIERLIWQKIVDLITQPEQVIEVFEQEFVDNRLAEHGGQIQYLGNKISQLQKEKLRWDTAYAQEVIEVEEYGQKVGGIREQLGKMEKSYSELERQYEQLKHESNLKAEIESRLNGLRQGVSSDLPHDLKRSIVTMLIDKIVLNSETGEGVVYGSVPAMQFEIHSTQK